MTMQHANQNHLAAQLSACGRDVMMGVLASERARAVTDIPVSRVRELVASRAAVVLPYRKSNRSYHLLFDKTAQEFLVSVVAIDRADVGSFARMVTVLTREQFEIDAGPISARFLRTAAGRALDPVAFRQWEDREFGANKVRPTYRVIVYFAKEDGSRANVVFRNPPLCSAFVDEHSLSAAAGHPGFWEWFARRVKAAALPIDAVLSIQIADTDKKRLDVNAPTRTCPCCAGRSTH
ncbi:hypothetical protein [Paraburkholderia sp. SIMBA_054]|uniref:hypothetical protein n=1 Tax=Paraburkholderia sp. SIMBA_054 TaxID=3085795 RepID=UPI00397A41D7